MFDPKTCRVPIPKTGDVLSVFDLDESRDVEMILETLELPTMHFLATDEHGEKWHVFLCPRTQRLWSCLVVEPQEENSEEWDAGTSE